MGGPCRRISIFLSVIDVHVQKAPVSGRVTLLEHKPGRFMSATRSHCAEHNESVLLGIDATDFPGRKIALRLIAGLIARRIVPWVAAGDIVARSERISLIQFGSRVEIFLPLSARVEVKLGDKVKGGETVVALMA
jgi:phosphatidylserine decarboxylase